MPLKFAPLLQAKNLTVTRGRGLFQRPVLVGINCTLHPGKVVMLVGPNGAGKTTLLETLAGDLPVHSGQLDFAGVPLRDWPLTTLARHRAVLRQHSRLTLDFSAQEVVALGCQSREGSRSWQNALVRDVMARTGVSHLASRSILSLSGGEQARVHLARAFAQLWPKEGETHSDMPRLLLLDEPCASLDPHYQHHVCRVVRNFATQTGSAVVVTMHDMNLAAQYSDRILLLREGNLVDDGAPARVLERGVIQACFQVDSHRMECDGTLMLATRELETHSSEKNRGDIRY